MKTVVKAYAKINLSLNVLGADEGYHSLDTIVTTIDLYDRISLSMRRDDDIKISMINMPYFLPKEKNNAYKAAKLFQDKFSTKGVDITIEKGIPVGGGLGGSSADVAGVLNGMKKLFDKTEGIKQIADMLGSDSGYMLSGGFARMTGRGDKIEFLPPHGQMWVVILMCKYGVNTAKCFSKFDRGNYKGVVADNEKLISAMHSGDYDLIGANCKNALLPPAAEINGEVIENYKLLRDLSPKAVSMSGSGSTVFGIFESLELCQWAAEKLKKQDKEVFVVSTI